jgi:cytochrome c biogenesis protein CcdA
MLALLLVVVSIALADSLNPSTIAPALLLATGPNSRARIAAFTAGVFSVSLLGGLVLVLGPGQLLLNAGPSRHTKHLLEAGGGAVLLALGVALWLGRDPVARRFAAAEARGRDGGTASVFLLGAGIMAVELPTAFPYFAAIAAIVGSDSSLGGEIVLVVVFNVVFVLPLLAILAIRALAGERAEAELEAMRAWLRRRGAALLAGLLTALGAAGLAFGIAGLA